MDPTSPPASLRGANNSMIRAAIMAVVVGLLAGYLFLWVMMPTYTYRQTWLPHLRAHTTSTYFGTTQGATYLVFTFPVLLIALFGCLYLHLSNKSIHIHDHTHSKANGDRRFAIWKRPMIIQGLGIVSRIELAFFLMFIALLVWNLANYLHLSFENITPKSAAETGEKLWEAKLDTAALRLGLVGNIALSFLFFPVTRGSSVLPLFGLTSEASVKYHIWLGHIVMMFFTAHGLCYIIFWASTHQISEMLKWEKTGISNVAGELSLLAGLMLWGATFPRIRRKTFELFFYTHHLYILFLIFFVLHVGISYACIMLPGFFLFMIDRYLRFLQSRRGVRLLSARVLPCQTVELNFSKSKGLSYTPTSIMFLNVPSISKLQWHPFTITSSSNLESDKLSVIVKVEGSWSNKLHQLLSSPSPVDRLEASVEGPYGPPSTDFLRHDLLVMVSGGSGITPFISIIRELVYTGEMLKLKTPKVLLISAFKNSTDLTILDLILPISGAPSEIFKSGLQIEAYVTREKHSTTQETKLVRTIWFKPNPSDAPMSPILGQNNWLWLGAIISSSFIIYLIFIGILTRYYIYPIDHNTNTIYRSASRALLHILFLCIGIVIAATTVFLWNKSGNARESVQIQNLEGATPQASPNSWYYNADRELESLPQQSLSQSINVHYGERPDLKRFLFERKESSVGVLVCGPKKMRHEVANICSSGLAANLHFESISFSW
ncbi:ferric reduction oxidase 2 [Sesamum indicum]|uniref:ferric-chelate reductase (NADH) n=1 Tax=Sesamum indicum TaxID=4182 RepID=A0A6I9U550_SESIN|nr:ferric reduction oxidase 2 [Sesamum indicum]